MDAKCNLSCCMMWHNGVNCEHGFYSGECYLEWQSFRYCEHRVLRCQDCLVFCLSDQDCECTTSLADKRLEVDLEGSKLGYCDDACDKRLKKGDYCRHHLMQCAVCHNVWDGFAQCNHSYEEWERYETMRREDDDDANDNDNVDKESA